MFYEGLAGERDAAGDGAADSGAQDRRDYVSDLEERRNVRRGTPEVTSSLSALRRDHGGDIFCESVGH